MTSQQLEGSVKTPRGRLARSPLAVCLAVALGTAALLALPGEAVASAPPGQGHRHVSHSRSFAGHPHPMVAPRHVTLAAHLRADYGAARAAIPGHAPVAHAVSSCADSGAGSLRDAVTNASSGDTIDLTTLACSTISLSSGPITAAVDDLTVEGPGAANLAIDAGYLSRALVFTGNGTLTVSGVSVEYGYVYAPGGVTGGACIASIGNGSLVLSDSTVSNCYAVGLSVVGGAIYSRGATTLSGSTVVANTAYGYDDGTNGSANASGGGVDAYGHLTVIDSTVTGNVAVGGSTTPTAYSFIRGGGLYGVNGITVVDSTISANGATYSGGGMGALYGATIGNSTIYGNLAGYSGGGGVFALFGTPTIDHATISGNEAPNGSGGGMELVALDGPADLQSTIISGNTAGDPASADLGYYSTASVAATSANNLVGASSLALPADTLSGDPLLGALADNGGSTYTMALGAGSPALDAGNNSGGLAFDQRGAGFDRVSNGASDIGAFELQVAAPVVPQVPVPTLSDWARGLLAAMLGALALGVGLRRRRRVPCLHK